MNEETIVIIQKECKDGKHMVLLSPPGTWLGDPDATCGYRCVCGKHAVIPDVPPATRPQPPEQPIPIYGDLSRQKEAIRESYSSVEPLPEDVAHFAEELGQDPTSVEPANPAEQECAELAAKGHWVQYAPTSDYAPVPPSIEKTEPEDKP